MRTESFFCVVAWEVKPVGHAHMEIATSVLEDPNWINVESPFGNPDRMQGMDLLKSIKIEFACGR